MNEIDGQITLTAAANEFSIKRRTLEWWVETGRLHAWRRGGGVASLVSREEVTRIYQDAERCCKGHECDQCPKCQRGICCRKDNPDYQLPKMGDWTGTTFAAIGELEDDGDQIICHCCGQSFDALAHHLEAIHGITPDEYRALFGLNRGTPLASRRLREKGSKLHGDRLRRVRPVPSALELATPEQQSAWSTLRSVDRRKEGDRHMGEAARKRKMDEPAHEAWRSKISASRGGRWASRPCVVCGKEVWGYPHEIEGGERQTCGPACVATLRSRLLTGQPKSDEHRKSLSLARLKIPVETAQEIRSRYGKGDSITSLAREFSLDYSYVHNLIHGKILALGDEREDAR